MFRWIYFKRLKPKILLKPLCFIVCVIYVISGWSCQWSYQQQPNCRGPWIMTIVVLAWGNDWGLLCLLLLRAHLRDLDAHWRSYSRLSSLFAFCRGRYNMRENSDMCTWSGVWFEDKPLRWISSLTLAWFIFPYPAIIWNLLCISHLYFN